MTLLRIAAGLARSSAPEHRWRRLAVPVSAFVFMLALLASTSVVVMADRQNDRNAERLPEISAGAAPTDLFMRISFDHWRGRQFPVAWISPADAAAAPVLAPGMRRFPEPGQAVVSPALAELIEAHPELARRFPRASVLGVEGVQTGGELSAYVRPPAGRGIGDEAGAIRREGGAWVGRGPVARVSGFGGRSGLSLGDPVSLWHVGQAVFGFVCLPGILVLLIGLAAGSRLRDHRFQVLAGLGAPGRTIRAIAIFETLTLAAPALAVATAVWALVTPHIVELPFLRYRLVEGDLAVPAWLLAVAVLVAVAACAAGAVAALALRGRRAAAPRPVGERGGLSWLAQAPLVAAIAAFVAAGAVGGDAAARLNVLGITLVIAGTPFVLPALLRAVGGSVAGARSVALSLAGSAMVWDPRRLARPFMGLGALVVVALVAIGYTTLMTHSDEGERSGPGPHAVAVEWRDHAPGDLARLEAALGTGLVVPFAAAEAHHGAASAGGHDHGPAMDQGAVAVGASCARLAAYVPGLACARDRPYALGAEGGFQLARILNVPLGGSAAAVRLVRPAAVADTGAAFALDDAPLRALDERTRTAAMTAVPAPMVDSGVNREPVDNPWVRWIGVGGAVAGVALSIACLLALVDRLLAARQEHRRLLSLGISPAHMTGLAAAVFALPYGVMAAFAVGTGLLICLLMLDSGEPFPWGPIGATALATLLVGAVGTAMVAALGSRQTLRDPE